MLKTRIVTSLILMSTFLAGLFLLPDAYWALLMLAFIVPGAWEWARLTGFSARAQYIFAAVVLVAGVLLLPGMWQQTIPGIHEYALFLAMPAAALFWLVLVPIWLLTHYKITHKGLLAVSGILVLLPAWLALIYLRKFSPWLLLAAVMVVAIADSAAYFSGKAFGRRKLAPRISPGKTWEGVIGAAVAVSIYGVSLCVIFNISLWLMVGALVLMILSIVGDLFESLLKRQAGVKDSSQILPGHGGILDRVDGLASTLPLVVFYLYFPLYFTALHD